MQRETAKSATKVLIFTGGGCSGKTTILSTLPEEISSYGIQPFVMEETARRIFKSGVRIDDQHGLTGYDFQRGLYRIQSATEDIYLNEFARRSKHPSCAIFGDRGTLDFWPFLTPGERQRLLKEFGTSREELLMRPDAVYHIVTAAKGAEEFYKTDKERKESPERARQIDDDLLEAWNGHPNRPIFPNVIDGRQISFDQKMALVKAAVFRELGLPAPLAIEKKYLIEVHLTPREIQETFGISMVETLVTQAYLRVDDNRIRRIRRTKIGNENSYVLQDKVITAHGNHTTTRRISGGDFRTLLRYEVLPTHDIIQKRRYRFIWQHLYFRIDFFLEPERLHKKMILEVEPTEMQHRVILPPFLDDAKEITGDPSYSNHELARKQ